MFPSHALFLLTLVGVLLLGAGVAHAGPGGDLLALNLNEFLSGLATRSRVIQVAAVGMGLALLIILKKFDEPRS